MDARSIHFPIGSRTSEAYVHRFSTVVGALSLHRSRLRVMSEERQMRCQNEIKQVCFDT